MKRRNCRSTKCDREKLRKDKKKIGTVAYKWRRRIRHGSRMTERGRCQPGWQVPLFRKKGKLVLCMQRTQRPTGIIKCQKQYLFVSLRIQISSRQRKLTVTEQTELHSRWILTN
jgi:hypothetical protein